jgi:hypothetical protein
MHGNELSHSMPRTGFDGLVLSYQYKDAEDLGESTSENRIRDYRKRVVGGASIVRDTIRFVQHARKYARLQITGWWSGVRHSRQRGGKRLWCDSGSLGHNAGQLGGCL